MPRGIPSAVHPGSTLSDSLGRTWRESNTCKGTCWGLANWAGNHWTSHKLNMVSQGLHFTPSLGGSSSSQPWVLPCFCCLMPTNLCVHCQTSCCCQLVSSNLSGRCQLFRSWQEHWDRLIHCISEIQAAKILCLSCLFCFFFCFFLLHLLAIPDILPVKQMKTNKKIIKATQRPVQSSFQAKVWVI